MILAFCCCIYNFNILKTSLLFDTVVEMGIDCTVLFVLVFIEASDQFLALFAVFGLFLCNLYRQRNVGS